MTTFTRICLFHILILILTVFSPEVTVKEQTDRSHPVQNPRRSAQIKGYYKGTRQEETARFTVAQRRKFGRVTHGEEDLTNVLLLQSCPRTSIEPPKKVFPPCHQ